MQEPSIHNEKALLEQIAQGSETAFRQLFQAYRRKLFSYVYTLTESREIAEDAVQDIFLTLWDKRAALASIDNVNAYLHRMAHNHAYQGFRRVARETLVLDYLKQQSSGVIAPEQPLLSKEMQSYIRSLVDRLTPQQRKVFLLSREEGLKQEEIAARLNLSKMAVKKHMVDALRFLRDEIGQNFGSQSIALYVIYQVTPV